MSDYLTSDIVLVRHPFSDLQVSKVRPAIIVSALHISRDVFIVPLTSRITDLLNNQSTLIASLRSWLDIT